MLYGLIKALGALIGFLISLLLIVSIIPGSWYANRIAELAANFLEADVSIDNADLTVLSFTPGIVLHEIGISGAQNQAELSFQRLEGSIDLAQLLKGTISLHQVKLSGGEIVAAIDESGDGNWLYLTRNEGSDSSRASSETVSDAQVLSTGDTPIVSIPEINRFEVTDVDVLLDDRFRDNSFRITIAGSGSTVPGSDMTKLSATGSVDDTTVDLSISTSPLSFLTGQSQNSRQTDGLVSPTIMIDANLGNSQASVAGSVGDISDLKDFDIVFQVNAEGLDDIQVLTNKPLPLLPPFELTGDVARDGDDWLLRRFAGSMGDSDIEGDIRINPATLPPTLYANLISRTLDLDDLGGLLGASPDPNESATQAQQQDSSEMTSADEALLPDSPVVLKPLTEAFDGAVEYQAIEVRSPVWPVEALDVRVEIDGQTARVELNKLSFADGDIDGGLTLDVAETPAKGELSLQVKRIDLRSLLAKIAGIETASVGQLGGEIQAWFSGGSIAQMAASADGGAYLLMTGGELDALLVELLGVDLTESLSLFLAPGTATTTIDCAFVDLQTRAGEVDIATMVLDTKDTIVLADGSVNLAQETLDIKVEPHPKDASIVAAQTAVNVTGSFTDIAVTPGSALATRTVAAAILASIVSPAAAIIPFIDVGSGTDSNYCSGMVNALDDAR